MTPFPLTLYVLSPDIRSPRRRRRRKTRWSTPSSQVSDFGFRFSGSGFRVGFRVGFRDSGFGFRVPGFGFQVSGFGFWVSGFGSRVLGCEFRVSGFGLCEGLKQSDTASRPIRGSDTASRRCAHRGTSLIRNSPLPQDHHRTPGIVPL